MKNANNNVKQTFDVNVEEYTYEYGNVSERTWQSIRHPKSISRQG
jgi:hypothetical protein